MKTKTEEIAALRALAQELGPDSYLGPWILDNLEAIEADMRADIPPTPSWSDQRGLHAAAMADAKEIRAEAERERQRIIDGARAEARQVRDSVASDLRKLADSALRQIGR